jgi:outer membrane protein TolC
MNNYRFDMNTFYKVFFVIIGMASSVSAQTNFSIEDVIVRAQSQSPASKQAETRKENRYWLYRLYRTNYNPQLRLFGNIPYSKEVSQAPLADGTFVNANINQLNSFMNLGLEQPIPWTNGTISVNSNMGYFNNYNYDPSSIQPKEQWRGTVMNIQLNQPVFAFNPLRWDKLTEPLRFEESKRDYVEQMEFISRESVGRFFDVLESQINLQIAQFNLANNDTIYKIEQGRYNIGTTSQDKLLQVELQLLNSRKDVAQAKLDTETRSLQLRSYIGLTAGEQLKLILPETIPQFDVSAEEAMQYAKKNRAAFIAFERRRLEAAREVAQARGQRWQTNLTASYGLNNNGLVINDLYQDPQQQQQFNLTLSVPIIDWGRNKSRVQTAMANKKLNDYIIAQDEMVFEQEIITQVGNFEMLRLQIEITKKSDEVAQQRYTVAQNRYLIGKIDITNLNIALTEKDTAKRNYIAALKSFWTAYYDLRRLTLYDFYGKRLLYLADAD